MISISLSWTVTIDLIDGPEVGPQSLQVQTENGYFVLSLGEDDGEDYNVRTYANLSKDLQQVSILGNLWDSKLVCTDPDVVMKIFQDFFKTGDVSRDLLN
jgi:hypothetical protein